MFALRGHDDNKQLASTASNTLKLRKDSRGLFFSFELPATSDGDDLAELYRVGGQNLGGQCSFGFLCNRDSWSLVNNVPTRTVLDLTLFEISVGVISPAYSDTSAALRSMPASMRELLKRDDSEKVCSCRCTSCAEDRCDQCDVSDCGDDSCEDCPMQNTDSERSLLLLNIARRRQS